MTDNKYQGDRLLNHDEISLQQKKQRHTNKHVKTEPITDKKNDGPNRPST